MQPTRTQAVKRFLELKTHADLAVMYNHDMEVQVSVAQDGGTRVEGEFKGRQWHGWTDGLTTWKTFRIPIGANSEPHYEDRSINFDLGEHVEGIGMTGWDWVARRSRWVGFDFDAITGHSERHAGRLTDVQLREVEQAAQNIPWVTVRRSTSGKGLHLYVMLDGTLETLNHNEHAAAARAILGMMSGFVGFDFSAKVDAIGGNMWVWHRKMVGTDGLELIKSGETLREIPTNWRDHVKVVTGRRRKALPTEIEQSPIPNAESLFEELTGQRATIQLDAEHRKLMDWLRENNCVATWDADYHMLVTHTKHLADAHEALNLKGVFETMTRQSSELNCFAFPIRRGAWVVRRYSPGVQEAPSWDQDTQGWTRCFLNKEPDLKMACRATGGIEHPAGGFYFREAEQAAKAAMQLGADLKLPTWAGSRNTKLKESKDGRLVAEITHEKTDNPTAMEGWIQEGKFWKRVFNASVVEPIGMELGNYDDIVRHLVTEASEDYGWVIRSDNSWRFEPWTHVKTALGSLGLSGKETGSILGSSIFKPWQMVNRPFQPEYPGDRQWNRGAAQFRYHPTVDRDNLKYPNWMKILNHIGAGLDSAVQENGWAKANGISTGADYLKCWIASMFQEPNQPLPYLFLYSPEQNTGKSSLHEGISLLLTSGVVRADTALISQANFNGELEKAILCVVEETDLKRHRIAYNRIKDWVTSREISIHRKGETPYSVQNTTKWIQCANDHSYCPVFTGDTRITMIRVPLLEPSELIPKKILLPLLEKEAPDFMAELLNLELPPSNDRLNVPVIITDEKIVLQQSNRTFLEIFLDENVHQVDGEVISVGEFYERFKEWVDPQYLHEWSKVKVGREMPPVFPKGRLPAKSGQWFWGNISWTPRSPNVPLKPKFVVGGDNKDYLVQMKVRVEGSK